MLRASYNDIVKRLASGSGLGESEVDKRIKAKQAGLSGLISLEGAALIVAGELGVAFDKQKVKISELLVGMRNAEIVGKVVEVYPVRTYRQGRDKDIEGKVSSLLVADETASVRVVLWDTNHIKLIEDGTVKKDSVVHIKDSDVRGVEVKELHLGGKSSFELSDEKIEKVKLTVTLSSKKVSELSEGDRAAVRAFVVQIFSPRFFPVCPECRVRAAPSEEKYLCKTHNEIVPVWRPVLTLFIDDGYSNIRAVCFLEAIRSLFGVDDEKISSMRDNNAVFSEVKDKILGQEYFFEGRARKNSYFDRTEFIVNSVSEVDVDKLVEELQGREV